MGASVGVGRRAVHFALHGVVLLGCRMVLRSTNKRTWVRSGRASAWVTGSGIFFFFQAEDGIRDVAVTGVQTCALPISPQSRRVDRPNLVKSDEPCTALKAARDAPRVGLSARRHRRDHDRVQVAIQLVGRHDDARARLANLTPARWIEPNKVHIPAYGRRSPYLHARTVPWRGLRGCAYTVSTLPGTRKTKAGWSLGFTHPSRRPRSPTVRSCSSRRRTRGRGRRWRCPGPW